MMHDLLLHSGFEINLGQFHPIFIHFPIVLFSCALICDVLYNMNKKGAFYVGHWLIIAGAILFIPTVVTGLYASNNFDSEDPYLFIHKILGISSAIAGIAFAFIRWAAMTEKWVMPSLAYVIISLIIVSMIYWTSDYGGLMTRSSTPFSQRENHLDLADNRDDVDFSKLSENQLYTKLNETIGVNDVIPIFNKARCVQCHSDKFDGGHPIDFSKGKAPEDIFLPRLPDGSLQDFEKSPFYQIVILENRMPMNHHNQSLGLSIGERLILLQWLKNNAPSGG
jgi:uncharacterized membrane protein